MSTIKKRAFRHNDCEKSHCPVRRERMRKITKLEGDIALLTIFGLPAPIAKSDLDVAKHFQAQCNSGKCHS